ncbi:MAG TPA: GLPGLI family protein [Chitinophagaceae bacterium]
MKRIFVIGCALFAISTVHAQQKEGKVTYQRAAQMQARTFSINGMTQELPASVRTDKFVLSFGNNSSLWKQADPDNDGETFSGGGDAEGFQMRMVVAGSNDVVYHNFDAAKRVEKREMFEKTFVIEDSVRPLKWKMTGETKTILGHTCMKATATNITKRPQTLIADGKIERKEITDTSTVEAWFANDIPVSGGPAEYQGQLPGLILEMNIGNGRIIYTALEISPKVDVAIIKEPTGKKRYTPAEFQKERDKMMDEMNKNMQHGGGNRRIIMN